ncbi:glycosyltransferase family 4 protein [Reinekea sp.]|uniref:glycosyltransferase family 4 protein n=1 Tax=Reinekea sp. TaxID=1970455 RepID=UPI002A808668|nr:glycosyltransferase family 4 protein [Reinekea sp.]
MTSQKPTILHVIDTTGPGGAETVFLQLADACNQHGYRSIAVIRAPGWVEDQLKKLQIEYHIIECKGSFNLRFLWSLVRLVYAENIQVIQSHLLGSNVYASVTGLLTLTRVISTFHGHVDISPSERYRAVKFRLVSLGSDSVVTVTRELLDTIRAMGNNRLTEKSVVISNGINLSKLMKLPIRNMPVDRGSPVLFGMLGNIRTAKNYFLAIDFIKNLRDMGGNALLQIAGDDSKALALKVKQYVLDTGLNEFITFLGFIDDVPEFFSQTDVFLMTSSSEGQPLALTQALAAGVPVLTTPSGVEGVVVDGVTAFISSEHSVESLVSKFRLLSGLDVSRRSLVQLASKELARSRFGLEMMCDGYFELYTINR